MERFKNATLHNSLLDMIAPQSIKVVENLWTKPLEVQNVEVTLKSKRNCISSLLGLIFNFIG
jgi:hypothetical protein